MHLVVTRRVLKWLGGVLTAVIAGLIVLWIADNGPTPPDPGPAPGPSVHSAGTMAIEIPGVHVPPPAPGVDGPYVFRNIDLDEGRETSSPQADVYLEIHAGELLTAISVERAAEVDSPADWQACHAVLDERAGRVRISLSPAPTNYVCLTTDQARIALFRVADIRRVGAAGADMYTLYVDIDWTAWERQ